MLPRSRHLTLTEEIQEIVHCFDRKGLRQSIAFVGFSILIHRIWLERNRRLFERKQLLADQRWKLIEIDITAQLFGRGDEIKLKDMDLARSWHIIYYPG